MAERQPRLLVLGAHPDDAEFHAGGLILRYRELGRPVRIVSVTNGAAGHHRLEPDELTRTRRAEAEAVSRLSGAEFHVWDFPDAQLLPTLEVRERIIREIRRYAPDLVLTHRTNDYHPDHRAVGQAVQDASYLIRVPLVARDTPALRRDPVVAYMADLFTRPCPLRPDFVLDIGPYVDRIVGLLACHQSQVFEWLPYVEGLETSVPTTEAARLAWLTDWYSQRPRSVADRFRDALRRVYGERGIEVQFAEAFEISEYAEQLEAAAVASLFPFAS
jgi:LmbE family N-acetylglucosaminyl deacetylase